MDRLTRDVLRTRSVREFTVTLPNGAGAENLVSGHVRRLAAAHLGTVAELADKAGGGDEQANVDLVARVVCYCLTDESGQRVYQDEDIAEVLDVDFVTLQAIAEHALEHSGIGGGSGDSGN